VAAKEQVFVRSGRDDRARECPVCHRICDAFQQLSLEPEPAVMMKPGDITTCAYCGTLLMVTTIGWRPATDEEIAALPPTLRKIVTEYEPPPR